MVSPAACGQPINGAIGARDEAVDARRDGYRCLEHGNTRLRPAPHEPTAAPGWCRTYPPCDSRSEGRPASSALTTTSTVGDSGLEGLVGSPKGVGSSMRLR
jgi:hypothetical protein